MPERYIRSAKGYNLLSIRMFDDENVQERRLTFQKAKRF